MFQDYKLISYDEKYKQDLIDLLERIYAEYDQVLELDTLDSDLLNIASEYVTPSTFQILVDSVKNDRLVASVAVKVKDGSAELKRVFVDPDYRRKGIAQDLSNWAFEYTRNLSINEIDIWSDTLFTKAHSLYKKLGAEDMNQTRYLGGRNNVSEFHFKKVLH